MGTLAKTTSRQLTEIIAELSAIRIDATDGIDQVLPAMRSLLDVANLIVYAVRETLTAWELERWHAVGNPPGLSAMFDALLATPVPRQEVLFYDIARPAPAQRNRLVEGTALVDRVREGRWKESALHNRVLAPARMGDYKHHRALLCDGPSLVGWFGTIHPEPLDPPQAKAFARLLPAMRRRLTVERQLAEAPMVALALDAALERIGGAAFVIDEAGAITQHNAAARTLLDARRAEVLASLRDLCARRPPAIPFTMTELIATGMRCHWLAVAVPDAGMQLDARARDCGARWQLTRRQRDVLELLVRGMANATIAATLGIGARAVESHVTALFDRAGVDSRAALVARVLGQ